MKNELKTYNDKNFKSYNDKKFPNYLIVETSFNSLLYKVNNGDKKDNLIFTFGHGEKASVTALIAKCLNKKSAESLQFMKEKVHRNFWKDKDIQNAFVELFNYQTEKVKDAYNRQNKSKNDVKMFMCIRKATYKKYEEFFADVNKNVIVTK